MSSLYFIFRSLIILFGYFPVNIVGVLCNLLAFLMGSFTLIDAILEEEWWKSNEKAWIYFTLFALVALSVINYFILAEFLVNRKKLLLLESRIKELFKNCNEMRSCVWKYIPLLIVKVICICIHIHGFISLCTFWMTVLFIYWLSFWTLRILVFLVCLDIVKVKLILIQNRLTQNDLNNFSEETFLSVRQEYVNVLNTSELINDVLPVTLSLTTLKFCLLMLDIFYWSFLGIFKGIPYIDSARKYYLFNSRH